MNFSAKLITLRNLKVLQPLSKEQIEAVAEHAIFEKVNKCSFIYEVGDAMKYVYIIEKGSVKLGMIDAGGKILTKDIIYDHGIFGENIFASGTEYKEFAETMTETFVYKVPIHIFKKLVVENYEFANMIMNVIVTKLQSLEERLQNFVFRKAKERIVDFIYRSGLKKGIKIGLNECLIDHGMSHKEISYLTDTSRQTVARIMNELKKENYIHYGSRKSSKILIRNMKRMEEYGVAS